MKKFLASMLLLMAVAILGRPGFAAENPTAKLFASKCASCHGKDAKGNAAMAKVFKVEPVALDLTTEAVLEKKNEELDAITSAGKGKMPAYKGKLTPAEISALTAYLKSLAPK